MSERSIHVSFLSQDLSFADPLARALGPEFNIRANGESQLNSLTDLREWCDVVLLDLRTTGTQSNYESGLHLINEICKQFSHPPIVALCDGGNRQAILGAIDQGAYDTITNPPNMMELRLVLRRAHRSHLAEQEVERLKATARGNGKLHELIGTSSVMQELFALAQKLPLATSMC